MELGRCPWPWGSAEPLGTLGCGVRVLGCFCSPAGPQAGLPVPCPHAMELGGWLQVHRFMPEVFKYAALCDLQGPSKTISPQRCLAICMSAVLTRLHFAGCLLLKILQVLPSRYREAAGAPGSPRGTAVGEAPVSPLAELPAARQRLRLTARCLVKASERQEPSQCL